MLLVVPNNGSAPARNREASYGSEYASGLCSHG